MMKQYISTAICLVIGAVACIANVSAEEATSVAEARTKLRVGVYDSRSVATAFYRSETLETPSKSIMSELKLAMEKDKKLRDETKIENLRQRARGQQNLQHMQVFGNAPIHGILLKLDKTLKEQAKEHSLDLIVRDIDMAYQGTNIEVVDITDALVVACKPTAETLKTIQELKKHKPVPLEQFPLKHGK